MPVIDKVDIKISVIIPVYNAEKSIEKCLDSVLLQNISPIEIIIINDCSSDRSYRIMEGYNEKYPYIKIINNLVNEGAGAARNKGIKSAKGKYITFLDSDDWMVINI